MVGIEFSSFYRDIHINQGESQSDAIDKALQSHFSISFAQLELDFRAALSQEPDTSAWVDDVRFSVIYYDTLRHYQQLLDPSAYFRTAWLMDNQAMRQRSIVADYLRHPHAPQNLALETLLITASQQISKAQYSDASETLDIINTVLNGIEQEFPDPFSVTKLSADYFSISATLQEQGYEVQRIEIITKMMQQFTPPIQYSQASLSFISVCLVVSGSYPLDTKIKTCRYSLQVR